MSLLPTLLGLFAINGVAVYGHNAEVSSLLATIDLGGVASLSDAKLAVASAFGEPQQLHLSLTGSPSEMFVTFVLPNASSACADAGVALAGSFFTASHQTYQAGVVGWYGTIYISRLTGLTPGSTYNYSALACGQSSPVKRFNAAPTPSASSNSRVIVKADMGTVIPLGFAVAEQIERDNAVTPFDLAVLAGDIAYATVSPPHDEFEEV